MGPGTYDVAARDLATLSTRSVLRRPFTTASIITSSECRGLMDSGFRRSRRGQRPKSDPVLTGSSSWRRGTYFGLYGTEEAATRLDTDRVQRRQGVMRAYLKRQPWYTEHDDAPRGGRRRMRGKRACVATPHNSTRALDAEYVRQLPDLDVDDE